MSSSTLDQVGPGQQTLEVGHVRMAKLTVRRQKILRDEDLLNASEGYGEESNEDLRVTEIVPRRPYR